MSKPEKPTAFQLPAFLIKEVNPTLEKDGKIYARLITVQSKQSNTFAMRERNSLKVENYLNKPLECVVEIVKAHFFDFKEKEGKNNLPPNSIKGTFMGWETGYKFFQELVTMVDGETGDSDDEDFNEDEYDELATKLFSEWGVSGFGLDVYRDKPMIKTEDMGTFFLNEFIFEELIDRWEESIEPFVPVCFTIEELLLHGIKPYEGKWEPKANNRQEIVLKENEMIIRGKPRIIDPY